MVVVCSGLIIFNKVIAKILFANEFYRAWEYAPFLMISVVFGALSSVLGGIFTATKQSKLIGQTTVIGAVINIILNIILVYGMGPVGAAIATMISYAVVWIIRIKYVKKIIPFSVKNRINNLSYIILLIQAILMIVIRNIIITTFLELLGFLIIIILYYKELKIILGKIVTKLK